MKALLLSLIRVAKERVTVRPVPLRRLNVKVWHHLFPALVSVGRLVIGRISRDRIKVLAFWAKQCVAMIRKQGVKGTCLWLKTINVLIMASLPGSQLKSQSRAISKVAVSVSRDGLPRVIPKQDRRAIRAGDTNTIRLWLSLSGMYRVLEFPGKAKISTITDPGPRISPPLLSFFETFLKREFFRNLGDLTGLKVTGIDPAGLRPTPLPLVTSAAGSWVVPSGKYDLRVSSLGTAAPAAWNWVNGHWGEALLRYSQAIGSWDTTNSWYRLVEESARYSHFCSRMSRGRISFKDEPAGKVRAFAMVDYWTQCSLKPLHDLLFSILKEIPQDGTFDQMAPAKELLSVRRLATETWWSLDLSAATDRFPLALQKLAMKYLVSEEYAAAWATLMVDRPFRLPVGYKPRDCRYAVGQPMGAYSSWAAFALTHHATVQFAARLSGLSGWFRDYALLGDDIIIANDRVAHKYRWLLSQLGVECSLAKSMASNQRTFEFAKRVLFRGVDVSGFPWKLWRIGQRSLAAMISLAQRVSFGTAPLNLASLVKALGAGMKATSRAYTAWRHMPRGLKALLIILTHPQANTFLSRQTWLDWLTAPGPVLPSGYKVDTSTWLTPWLSGFREEYLNPALEFLEEESTLDLFEPDIDRRDAQGNLTRDSHYMAEFIRFRRAYLFSKLESLVSVERSKKIRQLEERAAKIEADLAHLQKLSISLQARNVSGMFNSMMKRLEESIAAVPLPLPWLVWAREENENRRPATVLVSLWERWRLRIHRSRKLPTHANPQGEAVKARFEKPFSTDFDE
ncbi:RNA-dependent RNA polymerase [Gigaspora margarita mitovirus 1]|uniref:RNA-dependent RNA polymerase n=1 Tax=Gigaspora margarita mitovirus 1 TaxID=2082665 RepID=A0A2L0VZH3_9VIRU|nr:RNA-dependent RNA polymerase [Gigaspora margarita mitovirus 1]AVA17449.1 RNA-dependent RNA polymerase [Gigaspora margarita mitovirus 1]